MAFRYVRSLKVRLKPHLKIVFILTVIMLLSFCEKGKYDSVADPTSPLGFFFSINFQELLSANENPTVVLSSYLDTVSEGQSFTTKVKLSKAPVGRNEVTLTLSSTNSNILFDGQETKEITFSSQDFSTYRDVTISVLEDSDSVSNTTSIDFTGDGISGISKSLNISDDLSIIVSGAPSSMSEGQISEVSVYLSREIYSDKTITISSNRSSLLVDSKDSTGLTFTKDNYNSPQKIKLNAVIDANSISEVATVSFSAENLTTVNFIVIVEDDLSIVVTNMPSSITEGQTLPIQVKLSKTPLNDIPITITSTNEAILIDGATSKSLNFTVADATTDRTLNIFAREDSNTISESAMIVFQSDTAASALYSITTIDITLSKGFISVSGFPTVIAEGTGSTIGVKFSTGLVSDTDIQIASNHSSVLVNGGNNATLNFTTENATVEQAVSLSAREDENIISETVTITFSATGYATLTLDLTALENDTLELVITGANSVSEDESANFSVALNKEPNVAISLNLESSNTDILTLSPTSLNFDSSNYSSSQIITMNGITDSNSSQDTAIITLSGSGIPSRQISILVSERNTGLVFSGASTIKEGITDTITLKLSENPGITKIVNLVSSNTSAVTISPGSLTFTPENWNTAQNIYITGERDNNFNEESVSINGSGTGIIAANHSLTTKDTEVIVKIDGVEYINGSTYTYSTIDFGYEYQTANITIENTAGRSTNLTGQIVTIGNDYGDFTITQPSVSSGSSISFTVHFNPLKYGSNLQSSLYIYTDDTDEFPYIIYLKGSTNLRTFVDNHDGTVSLPSKNITFMKCSQGQVYNSTNNDCTGTGDSSNKYGAGTYAFCSTDTDDCNNGDPNQLLGSGFLNDATSAAYTTCNDLNTTPVGGYAGRTGWRVPTIQELIEIRFCSGGNFSNAGVMVNGVDISHCTSGYYVTPTIMTYIFPNSVASYYWSSSVFNTHTCLVRLFPYWLCLRQL